MSHPIRPTPSPNTVLKERAAHLGSFFRLRCCVETSTIQSDYERRYDNQVFTWLNLCLGLARRWYLEMSFELIVNARNYRWSLCLFDSDINPRQDCIRFKEFCIHWVFCFEDQSPRSNVPVQAWCLSLFQLHLWLSCHTLMLQTVILPSCIYLASLHAVPWSAKSCPG